MDLFVYLSKFLPQLVYPAGLIFFMLFAAILLIRHRKLLKILLITALVVLWISGNPLPSAFLIRRLEKFYPPYTGEETADVIVVLGGGTETKSYPRQITEISGAGDRILYASDLYQKGFGKYLLTGGSYINWIHQTESSPASELAEIAEKLGVPKDRIIIQNTSVNTQEEAVYDAEILRKMGVGKIILVTSATHMRRAVGLFEAQGLEVIPAPTDYNFSDDEWDILTSFSWSRLFMNIVPQSSNMSSLETALKEYIGIAVYRLRGWMD